MVRYLITGANGQIGSALVTALGRRYGAECVLATDIHDVLRTGADTSIRYEKVDVTDPAALMRVADRHDIRVVYHLASLLSVSGERRPDQAWEVNVTGLKHVLDLARRNGYQVFWPSANCMDINRGDLFTSLVSMSSPSRGLQLWAEENLPDGDPRRDEEYALGDVNVSLLKTAQGRTVFLSHDTNLPRPYSRIHMVQGTRGLFQGYPNRVYVEGRSPDHRWEPAEEYYDEFQHPLWEMIDEDKATHGHGGMDYLENYRLIYCLRNGLPTDMNVYDAAVLSAVTELTEISVATGSSPVDFPDFTRGRWQRFPKLEFTQV